MSLSDKARIAQLSVESFLEMLENTEDLEEMIDLLDLAPVVKIDDTEVEWTLFFSPGPPDDSSEDVGWSMAPQVNRCLTYYEELEEFDQRIIYLGPSGLAPEQVITRLIEKAADWRKNLQRSKGW